MKKLFLLIALLFTTFAFSQKPTVQVLKSRTMTTTERDALSPGASDRWFIYNSTADEYQYWDGDSWEPLSAGADNLGNHIATQDLDLAGFDLFTDSSLIIDINRDGGADETFSITYNNGASTLFNLDHLAGVRLGSQDVLNGRLTISGNSSSQGAIIDLENSASEDTTTEYWQLLANDHFQIWEGGMSKALEINSTSLEPTFVNYTFDADQTLGPTEDNYVMTYDDATGKISLEASAGATAGGSDTEVQYNDAGALAGDSGFVYDDAQRYLKVGLADSDAGIFQVFGNGTSSTQGGILLIDTPADHDTSIENYRIEALSDDLSFGRWLGSTTPIMTYDGTNGNWRFDEYGSGSVTGTEAYDAVFDSSGTFLEIPYAVDRLEENATVTGTYDLDYSLYEVWNLTLTGITTFTESNLPTSGTYSKVILINITGDFALTYPANWSTNITGTYDGTVNNVIAVWYVKSGVYKVTITQPD